MGQSPNILVEADRLRCCVMSEFDNRERNTGLHLDEISFSELRYRRLFEAARDGILIIDPETRQIVDVNPFLIEFLGYSFDELFGKELYQIGLHKDEETSKLAFQELLTNGHIRYEDIPLRARDGRMLPVEFVSNVYMEGERRIIQCNIRDISERKRAEEALGQSEERFKLVASTVSDAIWDWNIVTDNLWWSDGLMTAFGYEANEIEPGRKFWERRIHPHDSNRVVALIAEAVDTDAEFWSSEYRFRRRNGGYAVVLDQGHIMRDAKGRAIRMVGGMRDLTEQKSVEVRAARAHRMESIGTLAGGIAHDLNNVLTPIMMSIELLQVGSEDDPDRLSILDTIQISCHRGADLVRQVLTFARGLEGQRVPILLRKKTDDLKRMLSESFPRNIRISTRIPDDLWPFTGDPVQLHKVLLNLAVNARDAMPKGGVLTISAENVTLDANELGLNNQTSAGRHILLQVSDTGTGITNANFEHIFEPFFTTKKMGEGTGFGLAIVHTIIKGHGGFLTVESEVGEGTTFKIWLPADPPQRAIDSPPPSKSSIRRGEGELVLVVDDEATILEITQRYLEFFGYRVITAANGAEAVAQYAKHAGKISLVITDMMMPIMDGATAIREIKRINRFAKILIVSGLDVDDDVKSGVSGFVTKPYTAPELAQKVRDALDGAVARN